jgi:UDP-N-acetylmuramate dehydrogenase
MAINLASYTTFGVQANADAIKFISKPEAIDAGLSDCRYNDIPYLILGSGSNMLFAEDFPGVVFVNELKGKETVSQDNETILLNVASGENWHDFVAFCMENKWFGLENLALIPGTVGAAPIQNIGAYGAEVSEFITKVFVLDIETGNRFWMQNADCEFGYRDSLFKKHKERYFVEMVQFSLSKAQDYKPRYGYESLQKKLEEKGIITPTASDVFEAVIDVRQSRLPDPKRIGNAGSFFKNPVVSKELFHSIQQKNEGMPFYTVENGIKIPAGWLIQQCGLKGIKHGSVGTYEHQALVLVNHGGATATDVWDFANFIIQEVYKKFSIKLVPEVNVVKSAKIMVFD